MFTCSSLYKASIHQIPFTIKTTTITTKGPILIHHQPSTTLFGFANNTYIITINPIPLFNVSYRVPSSLPSLALTFSISFRSFLPSSTSLPSPLPSPLSLLPRTGLSPSQISFPPPPVPTHHTHTIIPHPALFTILMHLQPPSYPRVHPTATLKPHPFTSIITIKSGYWASPPHYSQPFTQGNLPLSLTTGPPNGFHPRFKPGHPLVWQEKQRGRPSRSHAGFDRHTTPHPVRTIHHTTFQPRPPASLTRRLLDTFTTMTESLPSTPPPPHHLREPQREERAPHSERPSSSPHYQPPLKTPYSLHPPTPPTRTNLQPPSSPSPPPPLPTNPPQPSSLPLTTTLLLLFTTPILTLPASLLPPPLPFLPCSPPCPPPPPPPERTFPLTPPHLLPPAPPPRSHSHPSPPLPVHPSLHLPPLPASPPYPPTNPSCRETLRPLDARPCLSAPRQKEH
ncbi:hypothetical protein C7M84_017325 [Penaeus vannamei]|uniref:Uncharacterized protein n=1 Tax=Penaeus vannamei TaxID=6689 RepID=A0A3R7LW55_PENVA|nr:hypothetical protein C7M84_017325 [Penaeus vannamei]